MLEKFFLDSANTPFLIALAVLTVLCIVVVIGTFSGLLGDAGIDGEIDTASEGVLDFLGFSAVPSSIFVVLFSSTFFLSGFITQWIAFGQLGRFLNGWLAVIPALAITVPMMHVVGRVFKKFKVKEDSSAVHGDSFIGATALISGGTARIGLPAQGKVVDAFRQTHYILVEPAIESETFPEGSEVLLLQRSGPKYFAVSAGINDLQSLDMESLTNSLNKRK